MTIYYRCAACEGQHPHSVSLTRQTFDALQSTPHITWLHDWSLCPRFARVVEVRSQDLLWREPSDELEPAAERMEAPASRPEPFL